MNPLGRALHWSLEDTLSARMDVHPQRRLSFQQMWNLRKALSEKLLDKLGRIKLRRDYPEVEKL